MYEKGDLKYVENNKHWPDLWDHPYQNHRGWYRYFSVVPVKHLLFWGLPFPTPRPGYLWVCKKILNLSLYDPSSTIIIFILIIIIDYCHPLPNPVRRSSSSCPPYTTTHRLTYGDSPGDISSQRDDRPIEKIKLVYFSFLKYSTPTQVPATISV